MATLGNKLFAAAAADGSHKIISGSDPYRPDHRNGQSVARIRRLSFVIADLTGIWAGAALGLAAYFKFCVPSRQAPHLPYVTANLGSILLYSALIALFCNTQRLYAVYQSSSSLRELLAIVKAISMASLLLTASIYISGLQGVSRVVIGTTLLCYLHDRMAASQAVLSEEGLCGRLSLSERLDCWNGRPGESGQEKP
jgi:hypothetical protein